ncbi:endonuclease/exonuclease/phosphatase family protein [Nocardioides sp. SYSU DS0663]|uniref:endonuclease/exonuclease/phosphatase family protein n=1 Tax=Nocardioides sp. SYSU DS0663 TaxID=3416445 RepID=UPI003F4B789D
MLPSVRPAAAARPAAALVLTLLLALATVGTSLAATPGPAAAARAVPTNPSFQIATFNQLGSQHTERGSVFGPGRMRARLTAQVVQQQGIDLIGFQEVQEDQLRVLENRLDGYAMWPARELGGGGMRLQIAWKKWLFRLLDHGSVMTAFDRQVRPVPWVLLEHKATGRQLYVVDVHNSARELEDERDSATRKVIRLVEELRATRRSVFVVGDMNEHTETFCKLVGRTDLVAANGGEAASPRECSPPPGRLYIDWIFGAGPMTFSRYQPLADSLVQRASDHNLIKATVTMRPRRR